MKNAYIKLSTIAALLFFQPVGAETTTLTEMATQGKTALSFRYRYEFVDQADIDKEANASTLRSRLTWNSALYKKFQTGIEVDNVTLIGDERYRTPSNGETAYPVVADPDGTDLNQAFIRYSGEGYSAVLGRQRILHGSQRFIGGVGWRQNEQTFDAFRLSYPKLGPVNLDYSYIWNINRIFGPDNSTAQPKRWQANAHALTASYTPGAGHQLGFFSYLLDFENSPANASATYGLEYQGKLGATSLTAAIARQSDYAENPIDYATTYYLVELGTTLKGVTLGLGHEVLGSDNGTAAFATPLATLHKFQGWSDKFLGTPATGIRDSYVKIAGKLGSSSLALIYHNFSADQGDADYGSEIDVVAGYPLSKNLTAQLKYASYAADSFATDTDKLWFTLELTLE